VNWLRTFVLVNEIKKSVVCSRDAATCRSEQNLLRTPMRGGTNQLQHNRVCTWPGASFLSRSRAVHAALPPPPPMREKSKVLKTLSGCPEVTEVYKVLR